MVAWREAAASASAVHYSIVKQAALRCAVQVVNVLGFSLPFYRSPTLLLSLGLSVRVLYYLITQRPDVIHVSSPGLLVFAATLYAKLLAIPLVVRTPAAVLV